MKTIARLALKAVTGLGGIFIAACYGVPHSPDALRAGRVVDARTRAGIAGIQVTCLGAGGTALDQEVTAAQGAFEMRQDCVQDRAEDVDGALNGDYVTTVVSVAGSGEVVIPMAPVP